MSDANAPHRPVNPFILVGLPLIAVLIAGVALYIALVRMPEQSNAREQQDALVRATGVGTTTSNKLAPEFTDADGDLVADAPTDPAKTIDPPVLRVSYIATEDPETYKPAFKEFCAALAATTGKKVEYVGYSTATQELQAIRSGELHVCALNTGNVPRAVNVVGFVPVGALASPGGDLFIRSVFITPASSKIRTLADIKGGVVTVTDPRSNSGYRVPVGMLKGLGLLPYRDYEPRYSFAHELSIAKVAEGKAELAAVASDILAREVAAKNISETAFRKVAESEKVPAGTIGYVYNLKPELAAKVRDMILGFEFKGTGLEKALGGGGATKFAPVKYKDDFALVRRIDDETGNVHSLSE